MIGRIIVLLLGKRKGLIKGRIRINRLRLKLRIVMGRMLHRLRRRLGYQIRK